ncbi:MAG: hypothetical protein EG826_15285 [Deltaproteobacteria bacterium]|nr:hypothetical protein [Deltaproteobacteria bacterium]
MIGLEAGSSKNRWSSVVNFFRRRLYVVGEAILLVLCTLAGYILLLYAAKYLRFMYASTPTGQAYGHFFSQSYRLTHEILSRNFITLAAGIIFPSFLICLMAGALFQFLHLTRYLYANRGFISRIIFFGLPLSYLVALYFRHAGKFSHLETSLVLTVFPVLCVFMGAFKLAAVWIPEFSDVRNRFSKKGPSGVPATERKTPIENAAPLPKAWWIFAAGLFAALIIVSLAVEFGSRQKAIFADTSAVPPAATADQARAQQENLQKRLEKEELEMLTAKYKAYLDTQEQLGRFKVLSLRFFMHRTEMQEDKPVVEIRVRNETPFPVHRVHFNCSLAVSGVTDDGKRLDMQFDIPGGLTTGQVTNCYLSPDAFSNWGAARLPKKSRLNASITRIDGPDGNALFALEELTGQEIIRLAGLKEKFGEK